MGLAEWRTLCFVVRSTSHIIFLLLTLKSRQANVVTVSVACLIFTLLLVCFQRTLTCLLAASWQKTWEREIKKEREKGNIRAFQGKLMDDWTAQIQPQDTLSLSHTHLHTSPIRPDDCLGARWQSTSLYLALFSFFSLHSLPPRHTHTHFVAC